MDTARPQIRVDWERGRMLEIDQCKQERRLRANPHPDGLIREGNAGKGRGQKIDTGLAPEWRKWTWQNGDER